MAQAPSRTNTQPMTLTIEPVAGAERVTVGVRQGWKRPDGVIVFDDGEKVMPMSGLSDQQKRDEALKAALGEVAPPAEVGAPAKDVAKLRSEAAGPERPETEAGLRQRARALVDLEVPRIEELKALAARPGVLLARDGSAVKGNALAVLHNHLIEAVSCAERGDVPKTAAALAELRRWSITASV